MADVKWIKIVTDIFDDEKILLIESLPEHDAIIVIWFKLLCLAGKMNNSGVFMMNDKIAYTEEMLATIFRRPLNTVRLALNTFESFCMIERVDDVITIPNWSKHQTLDQLEERKEYMRDYMQRYREKQKQIACKVNGKANSKANSKANVNSLDKNKKKIRLELDKELDIKTTTVVDVFNQNIHPITPVEFEKLNDWLNELPGEVVIEAIKEATAQNVRKWSYINGILTNWQNDGITTVEAVNARRRERSSENDRITSNAGKNNDKSEIKFDRSKFIYNPDQP